jgi:hypothetical protein
MNKGSLRIVQPERSDNLKSLQDRRDSPSVHVKPFTLDGHDSSGHCKSFKFITIDHENMISALDVSGADPQEDSQGFKPSMNLNMNLVNSGEVNDAVIEDIQKRLELLDEFR